jgi:hypothetical protein
VRRLANYQRNRISGELNFTLENKCFITGFGPIGWTPASFRGKLITVNSYTEGLMALSAHLAELSEKHKLLERRIEEVLSRPSTSDVEITRLKLEKLKLKDEITRLRTSPTH